MRSEEGMITCFCLGCGRSMEVNRCCFGCTTAVVSHSVDAQVGRGSNERTFVGFSREERRGVCCLVRQARL